MKTRIPLVVILASLALVGAGAGCSKHSPDAAVNQNVNQGVSDLGVVEVSDGVEVRRDLGGGRTCTIMPSVQKDGSVLLSMKVMQDGKLLAEPRIQTASDRTAEIRMGDVGVRVTPHIK